MMQIYEIIRQRRSVRTFEKTKIDQTVLEELKEYAKQISNPWNIEVRFVFMDAQEYGLSSPVLNGEPMYIAALVDRVEHGEEAAGYAFEKLMLKAVSMGLGTNASLDGRKKGEAISDNMGPVHTELGSHDTEGPTALANSVGKVDHSLAPNGTLLNVKFPENAVTGVEGRDNLISYIDAYLANDPMHIQFNIMSSETMKAAQKDPDNYRDMLVRVAGYSAYFVELGQALQKDLIQRTELHF
jgi:hypothetical protein